MHYCGLQISAATMENSIEVLQNIKTRTTILPNNFTSGHLSKENTTLTQKDICAPIFILALFPVDKVWKQPMCLLIDEWIKEMWYMYTRKYYVALK